MNSTADQSPRRICTSGKLGWKYEATVFSFRWKDVNGVGVEEFDFPSKTTEVMK